MARDIIPKGYVATSSGQVHYRRLAGRGPCVILLHWLPLSSRMFQHVMPRLNAHDYDVIAFDLLGYGRSDPRQNPWSMQQWAETIWEAASALGISQARVLGGHTGSCVAAELALSHSECITHVVLDGCPFLTSDLKAVFQGMANAPRPALQSDGEHEQLVFKTVATTFSHYIPSFELTQSSLEELWPAMIDYLETDFVTSAPISGAYDLDVRLPLINQPLLLLSAETDTLSGSFAKACELAPQAKNHMFLGDHPIHFKDRVDEYIAPLLTFWGQHD